MTCALTVAHSGYYPTINNVSTFFVRFWRYLLRVLRKSESMHEKFSIESDVCFSNRTCAIDFEILQLIQLQSGQTNIDASRSFELIFL